MLSSLSHLKTLNQYNFFLLIAIAILMDIYLFSLISYSGNIGDIYHLCCSVFIFLKYIFCRYLISVLMLLLYINIKHVIYSIYNI